MIHGHYSKYRDSNVEWLGKIPKRWNTIPLKYVTSFINGAAFKPADWKSEGIPIIRIENLNQGEEFNYYDGTMPRKYHIKKGDLLFGWSGNRGTSFGPFIWWKDGLFYLNQHIFKLVGFKCDKSWFYWVLVGVTHYVEKQAHGIIGMVHITKGDLGAIKIPLISLSEQKSIASFLDNETSRIDTLIAKKEHQIELLQEKRSALISYAVLKGLNPNAEMKDSGVEWLGVIPKHWDVFPIRGVLNYRREYNKGPKTSNILSVVKDVGVINYNEREASGNKKSDNIEQYKIIHAGDIVMNRMNVIIGSVGVAKEYGAASIEYYVLYGKNRSSHTKYYGHIFSSKIFQQHLGRFGSGILGHRLRIPYEALRKERVPKPPIEEQRKIAEFIDEERLKIDKLVSKIKLSMSKLKEYRAGIITAAVTGKIDVHKEAA